MPHSGIAMLFSGQGRFRAESINHLLAIHPALQQVFHEIDSTTGYRLANTLDAVTSCPSFRRSGLLSQMSRDETAMLVYGISVATGQHLLRHGCQPRALVGQSFGEIPAFVCGRVYTVAQGAAITQARCDFLRLAAAPGDCMGVLHTDVVKARRAIFEAQADSVYIASGNSPSETVISGNVKGLQKIFTHAARNGIGTRFLNVGMVLQNQEFTTDAAVSFHRRIAALAAGNTTIPIFSPALGRFYEAGEDPARSLANGLTRPMFLTRAFTRLQSAGITKILECGPLEGSEHYITGAVKGLSFVFSGTAIHAFRPGENGAQAAMTA